MENGDLIFTCNASPYCGYTEGPSRIAQVVETAAQVNGASCALSADGSLAAFGHSAGTYLEVFNTSDWSEFSIASLPVGDANALAFSPDGTKLAVAHVTTPFVTVYDTATWTKLSSPAVLPTGTGNGVAWSPDGTKLAVAHNTAPYMTAYNVSDWSKIADPVAPPASAALDVAFSPDGTKLAVSVTAAPWIKTYNVSGFTAATAPTLSSAGSANCLEYSPDGSKLAIGVGSGSFLRMFNTADWSAVTTPSVGGEVFDVAWVTNDEIAVACSLSPRLWIWNLTANTTQKRSFVGNTGYGVAAKRYTPVTISGTIKDINENGVARTLRAYRRDTGELVASTFSNGVTGAYSMKILSPVECDVVMLDDAAGSIENDQILRTTPV